MKKIVLAAFLFLSTSPLLAATTALTAAETGTLTTIATIDQHELLLAILASNKQSSLDVAGFAKVMIKAHGANLTQILEMASAAHASLKLKSPDPKDLMTLGGLQGENFDKTYIDAMVKGHQTVLNLINNELMKTAKSDEMKQFMTDTRDAVMEHLEDAKKIQESMK